MPPPSGWHAKKPTLRGFAGGNTGQIRVPPNTRQSQATTLKSVPDEESEKKKKRNGGGHCSLL